MAEKSRYAYVTFVMRNDSFIPGALVFAYALRQQDTKADLICIVTEAVSIDGVKALEEIFDYVYVIDTIYVPHKDRHERQDRPFLFTRFHALRLGMDGDLGQGYEKIILADADVLPIQDYDLLFELNAPAGIINEKKSYCMETENGKYLIPDSVYENGSWIWHRVYEAMPFGASIPKEVTDRVIDDPTNMGVNAALYLFEPSMTLFESIIKDTQALDMRDKISQFPWPEMQYITMKLSGKWHNMDLTYASFNGYPVIDVLKGIHFAGLKPWQLNHRSIMHYAKNEDYRLWYGIYTQMVDRYPGLENNKKLLRIYDKITEMQKHSVYQFDRWNLDNLKHLKKQ